MAKDILIYVNTYKYDILKKKNVIECETKKKMLFISIFNFFRANQAAGGFSAREILYEFFVLYNLIPICVQSEGGQL